MQFEEIYELLETDEVHIVIGDKVHTFEGSNAACRAAEIFGMRYVAAIIPLNNALEIRLS